MWILCHEIYQFCSVHFGGKNFLLQGSKGILKKCELKTLIFECALKSWPILYKF